MKICKRCGASKPEEAFYLNKGVREGTCYECKKERTQEWMKSNPKKVAEYARKWRKNNPASAKLSDMRAKAKRREAISNTIMNLTTDQWKSTLSYFGDGCAVCGDNTEIHTDHFVPVASGNGDTTVTNVIPLCASHNINKRDKHPLNWLRNESGACADTADRIITYLAELNGMPPNE